MAEIAADAGAFYAPSGLFDIVPTYVYTGLVGGDNGRHRPQLQTGVTKRWFVQW